MATAEAGGAHSESEKEDGAEAAAGNNYNGADAMVATTVAGAAPMRMPTKTTLE